MSNIPSKSSFKIKNGLHVLGPTRIDGNISSKGLFPISGGGFSIGDEVDFWDEVYVSEIGGINFGIKKLIVDSSLTPQLSGGMLTFEGNELTLLSTVTDISSSINNGMENISSNIIDISSQVNENTTNISEIISITGDFARLDKTNDFLENAKFQGDVDIIGTLVVAGSAFSVDFQNVLIKDNVIRLNNGEIGTGVTSISSGIEIDRGNLPNYFFIFNEIDDTFQIGENGSLQRVATRGQFVTDKRIVFSDNNNSYTESSDFLWDDTIKEMNVNGSGIFSGNVTLGAGISGDQALQKDQIETLVFDVSSSLNNKLDSISPPSSEVTGVSGVPTVISCVPIADANKVIWNLVAIDENQLAKRYSSTVSAIHNGNKGVDFTEYAILNTSGSPNLEVDVTNDGTNMCLVVTGASFWTIQASISTKIILGGGTVTSGLIVPSTQGRSLLGSSNCTGTSILTTSNIALNTSTCNGNLRKVWVTWTGSGSTSIFGITLNNGDTKVFCPSNFGNSFLTGPSYQKWEIFSPTMGTDLLLNVNSNNNTSRFTVNTIHLNSPVLSPFNRITKNCFTLPWGGGFLTLIPVNSLMS